METQSRHLATRIERPSSEVYEFAVNPANLPLWAAGLARGIELVAGRWIADSPMGEVSVAFVSPNEHGVLDHDVQLPTGETVYNPMRVIADGQACDVVFTLRRRPGVSDEDFDRDAQLVSADLASLKSILEARQRGR
ncbi:MAG: SRPBCC family protein [Sporichthyaceae bacterium]